MFIACECFNYTHLWDRNALLDATIAILFNDKLLSLQLLAVFPTELIPPKKTPSQDD
jgi:hypothetical protein